MTTGKADSGAAWENPLMPNARLRQIYLAMVKARTLDRVLPRKRAARSTYGLEACLVSPAVDLGPNDLISDTLAGGVIDFLRGATLSATLHPGTASRKRGVRADCGSAARLPNPIKVADRLWSVLGAAAALKALAPQTKTPPDDSSTPPQAGVVVAYALPGEVPAAVWRNALTYARAKSLPVVFVVLPSKAERALPSTHPITSLALTCRVPGMPVDADDAVAIYRVAQESILHARIGGGPALIECVPFVVAGGIKRRSPAPDAISGLEQYILQRRVATRPWMDRQSRLFAKQAAAGKTASK
jgi:TPP-dependent pyruvate/acetoin dehydrogenase alpha subunit